MYHGCSYWIGLAIAGAVGFSENVYEKGWHWQLAASAPRAGKLPVAPDFGFHSPLHTRSEPSTPVAGKNESATLPPGFFLDKQPDGAKTVEEVKASAKAGDKVAIRGRIGGSTTPFVDKRAAFTLMGAGLKACSDNPEDKCKTPWDYCCDTPDAIARHSATIQVVDEKGVPLRVGLKGANGLKELSEVIVQGTVKEAKEKVLIVNASNLYLVPPAKNRKPD